MGLGRYHQSDTQVPDQNTWRMLRPRPGLSVFPTKAGALHTDGKSSSTESETQITWPLFAVLPGGLVLGLLSLSPLERILGDQNAIWASVLGTVVATVFVWHFFLKRLDATIPLWILLCVLLGKTLFNYYLWTTYMIAPRGGGLLSGGRLETGDSFTTIPGLTSVVRYWEANGFTLFVPFDLIPSNNPIAMIGMALPYLFLSQYAEVLIPWNAFYISVAACAMLRIAGMEGFQAEICRKTFYLTLFLPFWWVENPLFRNAMEQMVFSLALLALLVSIRLSFWSILIATPIFAILSYGYRKPYAIIYLCVLLYAMLTRKRQRGKIARVLLLMLALLLVALYASDILDYFIAEPVRHYVGHGLVYQRLRVTGPLVIPYRLLLGLVAPLPWTNCLYTPSPWHMASDIRMYLQNVLGLALFGLTIRRAFQDIAVGRWLPASVFYGLLAVVSGVSGLGIHSYYVQVGMIFLIPYALAKARRPPLDFWLWVSFILFVAGNILWLLIRQWL